MTGWTFKGCFTLELHEYLYKLKTALNINKPLRHSTVDLFKFLKQFLKILLYI